MMRRKLWTSGTWLFVDQLTNIAFIFIFLAFVVEVAPPKKIDANPLAEAPMEVQIHWDDAVDADVDLWAKGPGDDPVGYSRKQGKYMALTHDDLGHSSTAGSDNTEVVQVYLVQEGEYVINAHLYRFRSGPMPIHVHLVVYRHDANGTTELVTADGLLVVAGQEITLVRFTLDSHGAIVLGSVNNLPMALRAAQ